MGIVRLLVLLAAAWLGWLLYKRVRALWQPGKTDSTPIVHIKKCEHCGLHVPENEAVIIGEHAYCSEAHRLADQHRDD